MDFIQEKQRMIGREGVARAACYTTEKYGTCLV